MSTISTLLQEAGIVRVDVGLDNGTPPQRLLYGTQRFIGWLDRDLPQMGTNFDADDTPLEQVYALLEAYTGGERLAHGRQFWPLRPTDRNVWEFKTADIRIFGWFIALDVFVATDADDATFIKSHGLYAGYRDEAVWLRNRYGLPFLTGTNPNDVLSFFN